MTGLIEELMADQDPRAQCRLCSWIESLPEADQKEWDKALSWRVGSKFRFTHTSIQRALQAREAGVGKGSIENHRASGHRAAKP